jgi:glycosyltransferase involved in cell wall biosynthesis
MRILQVHNFYTQAGGEDAVLSAEGTLLANAGHTIYTHTVSNTTIDKRQRLSLAAGTIWNQNQYHYLRTLIKLEKIDIVHVHNTIPQISPSVYWAARHAGAAVVQTLHNYRFICPSAVFFRSEHVCEDCSKKVFPWPAVLHSCYRGSRGASAVLAAMLFINRCIKTYRTKIDVFIALTNFARERFIAGGLPEDRIMVKPNFILHDPGIGDSAGKYALFVGRLTEEKGVSTLLDAWQKFPELPTLKIAGDGPLEDIVKTAAEKNPNITYLGKQPSDTIITLMKNAGALIFPSLWYEGFPVTLAEAFATGLPVVASNLGSMKSIITPGKTGMLFDPRNSTALAEATSILFADPQKHQTMKHACRLTYLAQYTPERSLNQLMAIYDRALKSSSLFASSKPA